MAFSGWEQTRLNCAGRLIEAKAPLIISASRATDIPAFYGKWFTEQFERGYLWRKQPYTGKYAAIDLSKVEFIVFWTKNPQPFLKYLSFFDKGKIDYYFLFTLNDYEKEHLEPGLPLLGQRIETFRKLAKLIGKERVIWRFDPILRTEPQSPVWERIQSIARRLEGFTEKFIFSFLQLHEYKKVQRNFANRLHWNAQQQECLIFSKPEKQALVERLKVIAATHNMQVYACADPAYQKCWNIPESACVDGALIQSLTPDKPRLQHFLSTGEVKYEAPLLFGQQLSPNLKDKNQRSRCNCIYSQDIGRYNTCKHGCVYCYACTYPKSHGNA